jgi:DNA-binding PadR family transcriptional regulator
MQRVSGTGTPTPDDRLASLGRLSEPALHVLISLAGSPKHSGAMTREIEAMTGRRPGPGTLYGAIARLEAHGWIAPLPAEDARRPYRLTAAGTSVLRARLEAIGNVARVGPAVLAETGA